MSPRTHRVHAAFFGQYHPNNSFDHSMVSHINFSTLNPPFSCDFQDAELIHLDPALKLMAVGLASNPACLWRLVNTLCRRRVYLQNRQSLVYFRRWINWSLGSLWQDFWKHHATRIAHNAQGRNAYRLRTRRKFGRISGPPNQLSGGLHIALCIGFGCPPTLCVISYPTVYTTQYFFWEYPSPTESVELTTHNQIGVYWRECSV